MTVDPTAVLSRQLSEAREECAKWRTRAERAEALVDTYQSMARRMEIQLRAIGTTKS